MAEQAVTMMYADALFDALEERETPLDTAAHLAALHQRWVDKILADNSRGDAICQGAKAESLMTES